MRLRLPLFALLLLVTNAVWAAEQIEVQANPINNIIDWNGTATYDLVVKNLQPTGDTIRFRPSTFEWGIMSFEPNSVYINANGNAHVTAKLIPPRDVRIGSYAIEMMAISSSDTSVRGYAFLRATIVSELPKLEPDWGIPAKLDPGITEVNLILKNAGSTAVSDITATLQSEFLQEPVEFDVGSLAKGEARLIWSTNLDIPLNTEVGDYPFTLTVYSAGKEVGRYEYMVHIQPKVSYAVQTTMESGFLSKTYRAVIKNVGNTLAADNYEVNLPSWQRFFLQSRAKHDVVTGAYAGTVSAQWPFSLQPGESTVVIYKVSFVPLLALLLALLLILYSLAWYWKQDLSISKEIYEENNKLKVKLTIRNGSARPRRNVVVEDTIHTPLKLAGEFATLTPQAVKKSGGTQRIIWRFNTIYPHEEKVLAYSIKSALPLIGSVILPSAKLRAKARDNKTKIYLSNQVSLPTRFEVIEDEEKPSR